MTTPSPRLVTLIKQPAAIGGAIAETRYRQIASRAGDAADPPQFVEPDVVFLDPIADQHRVSRRRRANACAIGLEQSLEQMPRVLRDRMHDASLARAGARPLFWQAMQPTESRNLKSLPRHEDVGAAIRAVIPPRPVPWRKRVLWRVMLWILRSAAGRRWLAALMNRGNL